MNPHAPSTALRNRAKAKSKEALLFLLGFVIIIAFTYCLFDIRDPMFIVGAYFAFLGFIGTLTNFSKALTLHADADRALGIETEPRI